MAYNVGVVGATGMVGEVFLDLLLEREFPVENLKLFASERSEGQITATAVILERMLRQAMSPSL